MMKENKNSPYFAAIVFLALIGLLVVPTYSAGFVGNSFVENKIAYISDINYPTSVPSYEFSPIKLPANILSDLSGEELQTLIGLLEKIRDRTFAYRDIQEQVIEVSPVENKIEKKSRSSRKN